MGCLKIKKLAGKDTLSPCSVAFVVVVVVVVIVFFYLLLCVCKFNIFSNFGTILVVLLCCCGVILVVCLLRGNTLV